MEEQFNNEAKEGWWFAASAARPTEETTGDEDHKHTAGGVLVAIDRNLGAVVGAEEGAIESIPGNEESPRHGCMGCASSRLYFWHSEGWTPRNEAITEAVLKGARTTKHPWLMACDTNMSPEDFEKTPLVSKRANVRDGSSRGVDVQIKKRQRRMGGNGT